MNNKIDALIIKSVGSFKWSLASNIFKGINGFVIIAILSRIIGPNNIGSISILMVIYTFSETISQFGISQSIISSKNTTDDELSTIFWVNLLIGLVLSIIIYLLAPKIAGFYSNPNLAGYLRLISIIFLFEPVVFVFRALLEKELLFNILERINIIRNAILSIVAILLTYYLKDISGYVIGLILSTIISVILVSIAFFRTIAWFPKLHFSINDIKSHYKFGFFVTMRQLLNYSRGNFDELIIGRVLGLETLGLYYFAKKIVNKPSQFISASFSKIAFPLYAKLKDDPSKVRSTYQYLTKMIVMVCLPLFSASILLSHYLIPMVFGEVWSKSILLIQIFSIVGFVNVVSLGFSAALLYVYRKPTTVFYTDLVITPLSLLFTLLGSLVSIELVAVFTTVFVIIRFVILQFKANQVMGTTLAAYFQLYSISLINTLIAISLGTFYLILLRKYNIISNIFIATLIISTTYSILTFKTQKTMVKKTFSLMK